MSKPRLFALLVGINKYEHIRPLTGCENDIDRMMDFLEKHVSASMDFHPHILKTASATKAAIVQAFEDHLIRKNTPEDGLYEGDVVLFYFSGHGALEEAHPVFWRSEPNHYIETLACYDSKLETSKNFLADKELRYLISQAAQPGVEVLTIFDCCHSGDNTRAPAPLELVEKLGGMINARSWEDFIFANDVSPDDIINKGLEVALPQGTHIQLAACNSHESAWEQNNVGGKFTEALLEALNKTEGNISYLELKNRTKNALRSAKSQTPQLYATLGTTQAKLLGAQNENRKLLFKTFLGGAIREKPIAAKVYFNKLAQHWELDKGDIYGVTEMWEAVPQQIVVSITPSQTTLATVKSVYPGFSVVEFDEYEDILSTEQYDAFVPSLMFRLLPVMVQGDPEGVNQFDKFAPPATLLDKGIKKVATSTEAPEYCVRAKNGQFIITHPDNEEALTGPVVGFSNAAVIQLLDNLKSIRRWAFVKNLQNPSPLNKLRSKALDFELLWNDEILTPEADGHYYLSFKDADLQEPSCDLKLSITNKINGPLFVGVIYLSSTFQIDSYAFWPKPATTKQLEPNLPAHEEYTITMEDFVIGNNWREEVIYFKVIAAVTEFDLDLMDQEGLDAPEIYRDATRTRKTLVRKSPNLEDWQTWLLPLHLINPNIQA